MKVYCVKRYFWSVCVCCRLCEGLSHQISSHLSSPNLCLTIFSRARLKKPYCNGGHTLTHTHSCTHSHTLTYTHTHIHTHSLTHTLTFTHTRKLFSHKHARVTTTRAGEQKQTRTAAYHLGHSASLCRTVPVVSSPLTRLLCGRNSSTGF